MATEPPTAQDNRRPVKQIIWDDVIQLIDALPNRYTYYGIPRGGQIAAGIARARGFYVTPNVLDATALLDDIIDSGATKEKWTAKYGLPFFSLYKKSDAWLSFPWDTPNESDGEDVVRRMLQLIGEDPNREGLSDTPRRVVRSWGELFKGYWLSPAEVLNRDFDTDGYDEMIVCRNIQFYSTCEHHLQPFHGRAHVGYVPDKRVVGLSKLARLVDLFARRLQIQERLTEQVASALEDHLHPKGVAVVLEAQHFCMLCRGVQKQESSMVTSSLKGVFRDQPSTRAEFYKLVSR